MNLTCAKVLLRGHNRRLGNFLCSKIENMLILCMIQEKFCAILLEPSDDTANLGTVLSYSCKMCYVINMLISITVLFWM